MALDFFSTDEFKGFDPSDQKKIARNYFQENISTNDEFKQLPAIERNRVYKGFLDDNLPKPQEKGMMEKVVDSVAAPFKAVAAAYAKDQEAKPTKPITATEKLELARPQFERGRRSEEYMKNLERDAELEQGQIKREEQNKKRTAQIEESKKPALQQLADQFNPARPIAALPAMIGSLVGGEETGKAIAKEFGGDYQYDDGKRDTTFAEANPDYVMAESIIADPLNTFAAPVKVMERAANIAKIRQAKLAEHPIYTAAEDIIQDSAANLGINLEKQAPTITAQDEKIAKALNEQYGTPKAADDTTPPPPAAPAGEKVAIEENPPADLANDMNVATKADEIPAAIEEPSIDDLLAHPRMGELLDMRRHVSAKQAEKKAVRESDRTIIHENNGQGYETSVIPENDVRNYDYDFSLTKADVKRIEAGKITPEIEAKLRTDLERLDTDPIYTKVEPSPLRDAAYAKMEAIDGKDRAEALVAMYDQRAKAKGITTEEMLGELGFDIQDMRHTTYSQAKADYEAGDDVFQAAYHGTPHNVDKFTTAKIGTGEGAQAYGHGLYFAGDREVAEWYRNKLAPANHATDLNTKVAQIKLGDRSLSEFDIDPYDIPKFADSGDTQGFRDYAKQKVEDWNDLANDPTYQFPKYAQDKANAWNEILQTKGELVDTSKGNLYKVELKTEEDELLLWDKPLSEQSAIVKEKIGNGDIMDESLKYYDDYSKNGNIASKEKWLRMTKTPEYKIAASIKNNDDAETFYRKLIKVLGSPEEASKYLHDLGIRGIKYVDGNHRRVNTEQFEAAVRVADKRIQFAKERGDEKLLKTWEAKRQEALDELNKVQHNYVIFHDDDIEIVGHNGKMLNGTPDELFQAKEISQEERQSVLDAWHKDSHPLTKNEDGTPKTFYHGTGADFDTFEKSRINALGKGYYFTKSPERASEYSISRTNARGGNSNVVPVYLHANNMLDTGSLKIIPREKMKEVFGVDSAMPESQILDYLKSLDIRSEKKTALLKQLGYDGIKNNDTHVVFDSSQIKSIHNKGTFDPQNPNILHQKDRIINGSTKLGFKSNGEMQTIVTVYESGDVSTMLHESAHVFERTLDDAERAVYNRVLADYPDGVKRQEAFAEGFVKWVAEGEAPNAELAGAFAKFKSWLNDLWELISTRDSRFELNDDMRDMYKMIMGDQDAAARLLDKVEVKPMAKSKESVELFHGDEIGGVMLDQPNKKTLIKQLTSDYIRANAEPFVADADLLAFQRDMKGIQSDHVLNHMADKMKIKGFDEETFLSKLTTDMKIEDVDGVYHGEGMDRFKFINAIPKTLREPMVIMRNGDEQIYFKPFLYETNGKEKVARFLTITMDKNGEVRLKTMLPSKLPYIRGLINRADEVYVGRGYPDIHPLPSQNNQVATKEIVAQNGNDVKSVELFQTSDEPKSAGGFYSAAERAIEKMPNKMDASAFVKYLKNNGVKDDEITWSGIAKAIDGKETITKAEIKEAFGNPEMGNKVYSKTASDEEIRDFFGIDKKAWDSFDDAQKHQSRKDMMKHKAYQGDADTMYSQYSIKDAGKNYREELVKFDGANKPYKSSHWGGEKNILLHTRKQDTVIDGERTLLVEEIQSDWMQAKRKGENVPDAPYQKTWHEFGMRQIIDEAIKNGYERVAWVNGTTQLERYSLSKSVDRLVYNKDANIIQGFKDGEEVMYKTATENDLESLIGKDPAKKLMDSEVKPNIYEIKGEALDIGGDGMKGFYDKILVDFTRKYTKKWGVEVETKKLVDGTEVHSFPVNAKMKEDVSKNGQALYAQGGGVLAGVGEDENGNMTFDPMMALAGIAGTSVIMSKTVRNNLSKLIGKTEHLSDSAIQGLVRVAIKGADKITAGSITKAANAIKKSDLVDYVVGHKIYGMKDYMKLREDALRSANAGMEQAAKLHLQLKELSSEAREAMYGYMSGDKNVVLTPELKAAADTFIEKIDDMGQQLVDEGILTKEAYEEWKGQYLHRKYASKMKKASDWASGKGEFGVESIKMRGKTWEATADEYQALEDAGMIGKVSEGKVEVIHEADGTYKLRRDWTKEERTAMGEIRDIAYSLPETVGRMAQMLHYSTMLKSIPKKYILAQEGRADAVMKGLGYEKLNGSRYGALNGKWVNQSIAGDLKRVANDVMGEEANVKKLWNDYVTAVKMSHTVYNPTAHVNNVGSNVFLQAAAGLNPLKTIKYATDGTMAARKYTRLKELDALRVKGLNAEDAAELSKLEGDADVALWKDLDEHRMFGRSQLNEMLRTYMSPHVDVTGGAVNAVRRNAEALYQGEDDVMRFAAVKQLMDDGLWIDGAVSRMDLKAAMKHVNDHIVPDYSKPMSKLALTLRDSGVVPFMSWMYYSTPILISQLKNHPTRVLGIGAAWYAMDKMFGVDPFETDGAPKGFAQQRVAVGRDGDKVTGMRVSSMIPHIQLANPANTFLEPLTSGIPQTLLGSATNYNFYFRKPITQKDGAEGTYHRVKDAAMNVLPSPDVIDKAYNLAESKLLSKETRRRDRVFEPRTSAQEAASFFVNLQTYDEGNHKASVRKERIKENKQSSQWERKMDRAMDKLFGGGN